METLRESFPRLGREGWIVVDRVQIVDFDRPPRDRTRVEEEEDASSGIRRDA